MLDPLVKLEIEKLYDLPKDYRVDALTILMIKLEKPKVTYTELRNFFSRDIFDSLDFTCFFLHVVLGIPMLCSHSL